MSAHAGAGRGDPGVTAPTPFGAETLRTSRPEVTS